MKRKESIIFLLIIFFLIWGCSQKNNSNSTAKGTDIHKPFSWGHPQTVYVFADENVWKYAEPHLRQSLERVRFTTENEEYFEVKKAPINSIEQFYKFNNLVFFCDMESEEEVSVYVKSIMGDRIASEIEVDAVAMYPLDNLWARDQFVLFIVGDNERDLLSFNIMQANTIFDLFKEKLFERIKRQVYKQKIYAENTYQKFPWYLKLPKNYIVYKQDETNNFISFIARLKNKPDRFISVYYEKIAEENFGKKWLKQKRAELAWDYYEEDEFAERDIKMEKSSLGKYDCWKLSGRWQNKKFIAGGAFLSFAIYDRNSQTAFLIDNSVYFPQGYKLPALIELEVISSTFVVRNLFRK